MAEIHKLTGAALPGEVNGDIVEALEGLLKRAKAGEIQAIAWAGYTGIDNDTVFNGWDGAGCTFFQLGAAISSLHVRYSLQMAEE